MGNCGRHHRGCFDFNGFVKWNGATKEQMAVPFMRGGGNCNGAIGESIRSCPLNPFLMILVSGMYFLNHFVLKKSLRGMARLFCVCYLNDLMCPLLFFAYVNLLLLMVGKELNGCFKILAVSFYVGLVWEFLAPVVKPSSVTDFWDLACYMTGGLLYWALLNIWKKEKGSR